MTKEIEKLSLRDQFAIAALKGIYSTLAAPELCNNNGDCLYYAEAAYKQADAMIEARRNKND